MIPGYGVRLGGRYVGVVLRWGERWRGYLPRETEPCVEGRTIRRVAYALEAIAAEKDCIAADSAAAG